MLKVFLVEDEIVVREGLRKNINWAELGFAFVGEAADGELAYPLIKETQPDLLITDIKMPFMDGLQLSKLVRTEMPWVKIIIISGYDDFEYAQKAIGIGVTEYLLKPVSGVKIKETVLCVKAELEKELSQKAYFERFQNEMREYEKLERKEYFKELVNKRLPITELLEKGMRLSLDLAAMSYNLVLFQFFEEDKDSAGYIEELIELEQRLEASFSKEPQAILFERGLEGFALLVKGHQNEPVEEATERCLTILRNTHSNYKGITYFAAVGTPVRRLEDLTKTFDEVCHTFIYRYLQGPNEIRYSHATDKMADDIESEILGFENLDPRKVDRKIFERFLKCGTQAEVSNFIVDYIKSFGTKQMRVMMFRHYIVVDAFFVVSAFIETLEENRQTILHGFGELSRLAQATSSPEAMQEYLFRLLTEALRLREIVATQKYRAILERAREFIAEHYSCDDFSLHQAAAAVNISPSHFSTIFSQETGRTFIEYLTDVRMEKAKELLRCSSMKTTEIGYEVGYHDPHYFSYLFKKRHECTPKEYRAGHTGYSSNAVMQGRN